MGYLAATVWVGVMALMVLSLAAVPDRHGNQTLPGGYAIVETPDRGWNFEKDAGYGYTR